MLDLVSQTDWNKGLNADPTALHDVQETLYDSFIKAVLLMLKKFNYGFANTSEDMSLSANVGAGAPALFGGVGVGEGAGASQGKQNGGSEEDTRLAETDGNLNLIHGLFFIL